MISILLWEIRRRKWFTFWWTFGISSVVALTILPYVSVKEQADELTESLGELSSSAGSFLGGADLFSPVGYISSQIYYITLPLLLIIMF